VGGGEALTGCEGSANAAWAQSQSSGRPLMGGEATLGSHHPCLEGPGENEDSVRRPM
jgi:hypothetical protein